MTEPRPWDVLEPLERLIGGRCPPAGELLLAVAAEFHAIDAGEVGFGLDELARPLFGLCAEPRDAALSLATLMTDEERFRTDESTVDGLLLDRVLKRRAGHPLALSALTTEIGRRAGIAVGVCSTPEGWYAGVGEGTRLWLIDPTTDARPTPVGPVRAHCGHELAYAALTGLYARFLRDGDVSAAARAAHLRSRLPVAHHE